MRRPIRLLPLAAVLGLVAGCSVVNINGSWRTDDNALCLIGPERKDSAMHAALLRFLKRKNFDVTELPAGTPPGVCRQTLVYRWGLEQYYLPALVKQYPVSFDFYLGGDKYANASYDPTRNLISPHVKFVPSAGYWARALDRLFPGRPEAAD
ncbi:hypothetical protein [Sutterella sp.]|uniref:hypothetical protein n=1 Tax=Sutterella sp. TaxID=1981025 RepID=UPI0026DFB5B7|nr:hypothetical protein [Sutterella sp.]MDO5530961.1 hypothetical protein [Sutterella sp.]